MLSSTPAHSRRSHSRNNHTSSGSSSGDMSGGGSSGRDQRAMTRSVRDNLAAQQLAASGSVTNATEEEEGASRCCNGWWRTMLRVPPGAVALRSSSLFVLSGQNKVRIFLFNVVKHRVFEAAVILIILINCVFLALDDPTTDVQPEWARIADVVFTTAFVTEMVLKVLALGSVLHKGAYHRDPWNNLDFLIVIFSLLYYVSSAGNLTAFRALRVLRPLRSMNAIRGLRVLVAGLFKAMGALVHVLYLAFFVLCIFGILGVQLWMGRFRMRCAEIETGEVDDDLPCNPSAEDNDYWGFKCPGSMACVPHENPNFGYVNFDNTASAFFMLYSMSTFEFWPDVLDMTFETYGMVSFFYFLFFLLIGGYLIPNLTLAVINDKFEQAQREWEEEEQERAAELEEELRLRENKGINLRRIRSARSGDAGGGDVAYDPATGTFGSPTAPQLRLQEASFVDSRSAQEMSLRSNDSLEMREVVSLDGTLTSRADPPSSHGAGAGAGAVVGDHTTLDVRGTESALRLTPRQPSLHLTAGAALSGRKSVSFNMSSSDGRDDEDREDGVRRGSASVQNSPAPPGWDSSLVSVGRVTSDPQQQQTQSPQQQSILVLSRTSNSNTGGGSSAATTSGGVTGGGAALPRRSSLVGMLPTGHMVNLNLDHSGSFGGTLPLHIEEDERAFQEQVSSMSATERLLHRVELLRCRAHMATEGYPRIISLFLHEQQVIQRSQRGGVADPSLNSHTKRAAQLMRQSQSDLDTSGLPLSPVDAAEAVREQAPVTRFTQFIVSCILLNTVVLASAHHGQPQWLTQTQETTNLVLTVVFACEMAFKLFAMGLAVYASDTFNLVDAAVVISSLLELVLSGSSIVSVFRALRLLRVLKLMKSFRSLRQIIRVMLAALGDTLYLNIILLLYLFVASLVGMQLFGGTFAAVREELQAEGDDLRVHFDSFLYAFITVFQVLSRDIWVDIMFAGMRATTPAAALYFVALNVIGGIVLLGLFLAILISAFDDEEDELLSSTEGSASGRPFDFSAMVAKKQFAFHSNDRDALALALARGANAKDVEPTEVFFIRPQMAAELAYAQRRTERARRAAVRAAMRASRRSLHMEQSWRRVEGDDVPVLTPPASSLGAPSRSRSSSASSSGGGKPNGCDDHDEIPRLLDDNKDEEDVLPPRCSSSQARESRRRRGAPQGLRRESFLWRHAGRVGPEGHLVAASEGGDSSPASTPPSRPLSVALVGPDNKRGTNDEQTIVVAGEILAAREAAEMRRAEQEAMMACERCGQVMEAPLEPPPLIKPRTAPQLHLQHCPHIRVRLAKQRILATLREFVAAQVKDAIPPTRHRLETVLHQGWTCGLMLSRTAEELLDEAPEEVVDGAPHKPSWGPLLAALEDEQRVLDLRVGEEQVGRSLVAYAVANIPKEHVTNGGTSMFLFGPRNLFRVLCSRIISNKWFDRVILLLIIASSLSMVFDSPLEDHSTQKYTVLEWLDRAFTICFAVEMLLKWVARGVAFIDGAYFRDPWNWLDAIIVSIALLSWSISSVNVGFLKVFRTMRALRPLRVVNRNRGLKMVVRTLLQSVKGITNVALLSLLNYLIFGILAVQFFGGKFYSCTDPSVVHRVNCTGPFSPGTDLHNASATLFIDGEATNYTVGSAPAALLESITEQRRWRTPSRNFDNIGSSMLAMFEVSTSEEWMQVFWAAVDAESHDRAPIRDNRPYMGLFFTVFFIISNFFLLNLFVGVVIYNFNSVKAHMDGLSLLTEEQKLWVSTQRLILSFRPVPRMRPASSALGTALDRFIRSKLFEIGISISILLNILVIGLIHYRMSPAFESAIEILNNIFVAIFLFEAVLKLVAYRMRYFTSGWNQFDFFLVVLSIVGLVLSLSRSTGLPVNPGLLRVFRIFRVLRILRLIRSARKVQILLETLWYSLPSIGNIAGFLLLVFFMYAVLGVQLFAKAQPGDEIDDRFHNFRNFENAITTLLRYSTGEDWNDAMHDLMVQEPDCSGDACGTLYGPPLFFISFMLLSSFVVTNLFVAIILDNFETTMRLDRSELKMTDLHRFLDIWADIDEDASMMIPSHRFPELLARLQPPLGISRTQNRFELMRQTSGYRIPEHGGFVHFVEVMIPLARKTIQVSFSERAIREHEQMWRGSFPHLDELPVLRYRQAPATIDMYFAATFIASAFRRRVAARLVAELRVERRRAALDFCRAHGLEWCGSRSTAAVAAEEEEEEGEAMLSGRRRYTISEALRRQLLEPAHSPTGTRSPRSSPRGGVGVGGAGSPSSPTHLRRSNASSVATAEEQVPAEPGAVPVVASSPSPPPPPLLPGQPGAPNDNTDHHVAPLPGGCDAADAADAACHMTTSRRATMVGVPMPQRLRSAIYPAKSFGPGSPNALRRVDSVSKKRQQQGDAGLSNGVEGGGGGGGNPLAGPTAGSPAALSPRRFSCIPTHEDDSDDSDDHDTIVSEERGDAPLV